MNRRIAATMAMCGALVLLGSLLLAGCQAVFTTSLLSFLQRDPANLPADQQVAWAEQALASGDPQAMAQAYELVKNNPDQAYLAASLAAELSGVPQALADAIADLDNILSAGFDDADMQAFLDDYFASLDGPYAVEAGTHFQDVMASSPSELTGQDIIIGALCLVFGAVYADGAFGSADPAEVTAADDFISAGVTALEPDDPAIDILTEIQSFVNSGLF